MSRSGYTEDYGDDNPWALIRWRGAVASSIRGKRGQAFLREMLEALDALPEKRLVAHELINPVGEVCALGSVGAARGVAMEALDPEDYSTLAGVFGVAEPLIQEIEYMNDEGYWGADDAKRWQAMRDWVVSNLRAEPALPTPADQEGVEQP